MGSLPNLHELAKFVESRSPHRWSPSMKLKHLPVNSRHVSVNHHRPVIQTRSVQQTKSYSVDKRIDQQVTLEVRYFFSLLQQLLSCSPESRPSTRSSSTVPHNHFHLHHHHHHYAAPQQTALYFPVNTARHRDSMSSSAGTSSVRKLIAVVRSTPSQIGPVYSRHVLCRNFTALCLGHGMITAAFLPLFVLQSSISSWWWPDDEDPDISLSEYTTFDVGSLLLSSSFALGAISSLCTPTVIKQLGTNWTLIVCYAGSCVFLAVHILPKSYILIPGYVVMGICLGPMAGAKVTALVTLSTKLDYVLSEEEEDEVEVSEGFGRRELIIQKLSRGMQVAQDIGLVFGNLLATFLLWYTTDITDEKGSNFIVDTMFSKVSISSEERVCGALACPYTIPTSLFDSLYFSYANSTNSTDLPLILNCKTSTMLASVFLGCCVMGLALIAALMDHIQLYLFQEHLDKNKISAAFKTMQETFKDPKLQLAAPLAIFIGLEQGFMYADFSKSYVVCSVGVASVNTVFMSLGLLQSVAAFTLSMWLQHIKQTKRYFVISVGLVFHGCLLMVLYLWKPTGDDPALLYVIAAAWGVCNAIWETLSFSLLTSIYPDTWQAAVGHNYFFRYLGLSLAFALHGAICNSVKLYALAGALILATAPYALLEVKIDNQRRANAQLTTL